MSLSAGQSLGAYEIVAPLGSGGMGEVYLAHDPRLVRDVAIKVLPPAHAGDPDRRRRFEQEARAAAALNHPNIVAIHDIGWSEPAAGFDPSPYIVMEYVRGETLSAHLRRVGRVPWTRALESGSEIAAALAVAHARSIVHRDLKPGNVMLMPDGRVKVLDFGLAKSVAAVDTALSTLADRAAGAVGGTVLGKVVGTAGYMSPEQRAGAMVDHRTDIYSLGVMLYELMTGRRPPEPLVVGSRVTTLDSARLTPADGDPPIPPAVCALVERAIAPDPAMRPASAKEFGDELQRALAKSGERSKGTARRRRVYVGSAFAAFVLIAAVVIARWIGFPPPSQKPVIAVLPLVNLTGDAGKDYLSVGIADALTTSLGQLSSVSVVPASTVQDSGKTTDLAKLARDVGATMLVQGKVQQAGDRIQVNANLLTPDGKTLWSGDSDAASSNLFTAETRLAGALVERLKLTITEQQRERLAEPPTKNPEALEAYWRGLALASHDVGSLDQAAEAFERAVALDPAFALAHAALGESYRRKSAAAVSPAFMNKAIDEVNEAVRLSPDEPQIRLNLASIYKSTGRNGAAVDELRRALSEQPDNADAHRQLGDLLAGEGRVDEGLSELRRAVALQPQYWRNYQSLGLFFYQHGRLAEAITTFQRLVSLRPDDALPYQQLGAAYLANGDSVHARENFERSVRIRPNATSFTNLGTIDYSERNFDRAARQYEQAVRLSPQRPAYWRNLGDAYVKLGRRDDAKSSYEKAVAAGREALTVNPADAAVLSELAINEAKLGRRQDAVGHAMAAVTINPRGAEPAYNLAVVYALNGDASQAMARLQDAIARGSSRQQMAADEDLASLRPLPTFRSLVTPSR